MTITEQNADDKLNEQGIANLVDIARKPGHGIFIAVFDEDECNCENEKIGESQKEAMSLRLHIHNASTYQLACIADSILSMDTEIVEHVKRIRLMKMLGCIKTTEEQVDESFNPIEKDAANAPE